MKGRTIIIASSIILLFLLSYYLDTYWKLRSVSMLFGAAGALILLIGSTCFEIWRSGNARRVHLQKAAQLLFPSSPCEMIGIWKFFGLPLENYLEVRGENSTIRIFDYKEIGPWSTQRGEIILLFPTKLELSLYRRTRFMPSLSSGDKELDNSFRIHTASSGKSIEFLREREVKELLLSLVERDRYFFRLTLGANQGKWQAMSPGLTLCRNRSFKYVHKEKELLSQLVSELFRLKKLAMEWND